MSRKIGLVFAGGGGKGAYQIGVWKALKETGLDKKISAVSGSSVGGLNAEMFALDNYDKAQKLWEEISIDSNRLINHHTIQVTPNRVKQKWIRTYRRLCRVQQADKGHPLQLLGTSEA